MKYTETHEWVEEESSGIVKIGISSYAQKELGEIVYVELPAVGKEVRGGQELAIIESTKAASDIYSPCTGVILEVNTQLIDTPELINRDPEGLGWIVKIGLSQKGELDTLLDREAYKNLIGA